MRLQLLHLFIAFALVAVTGCSCADTISGSGVDEDGDGISADSGDCDDSDPDTRPGAPEIPYDGVDQDCDGSDLTDVDGDSFDAEAAGGDDCDDVDALIHPGAPETPYDGIDQDCNGADLVDADGDGFDAPEGGGDDCDDSDPEIHPGAVETPYDGVDHDCDGLDPDDLDEDGQAWDGTPTGTDCDDDDPLVYLDAPEVAYDGIDQDCDGEDLTDADGDGFDGPSGVGEDCDDSDPASYPDAPESPYDGVDQDCSGEDLVDVDGDGFDGSAVGGSDCDDDDDTSYPGATDEPYDGVDQDCDGADFTDVDGDGHDGPSGIGPDCDDGSVDTYPGAPEAAYDGVDQDCDGLDLTDVDGDGWDGPSSTGADCDDGEPSTYPGAPEVAYDDVDQDCDGLDLTDVDGDGWDGTPLVGDDCDDGDPTINPGAVELPGDGVDNDCVNQPPELASAALDPASGDRTAAFDCLALGATDTDGNLNTIIYTWNVDGVADPSLTVPLPPLSLVAGQTLSCSVEVTDTLGLAVQATSDTLTIENAVPTLTVVAAAAFEDEPVDVLVETEDADGDPLVLTGSGLPEGGWFEDLEDGTGRVRFWPALNQGGTYALEFTADDGLDTGTLTWSLFVDETDAEPQMESDCDAQLEVGVEYRCQLEAEDPDGTPITGYALVDAPVGAFIDGATNELVWTPTPLDGGLHVVEVETSSGGGSVVDEFDWYVEVATLLASVTVEPATGAVISGSGSSSLPYFEVELPPGVFDDTTQVDVYEVIGVPYGIPDVPTLEIEADSTLEGIALITLGYDPAEVAEADIGSEEDLEINYFNEEHDTWEAMGFTQVDTVAHTMTAATSHFSGFGWNSDVGKRLHQKVELLYLDDNCVKHDDFPWVSGEPNLLLLHGWTGFAWFSSSDDESQEAEEGSSCKQAAAQWARNNLPNTSVPGARVIYYQYPSGRGIRRNARKLDKKLDELKTTTPGFDDDLEFHVFGYSMGGAVARSYAQRKQPLRTSGNGKVYREQISEVVSLNTPHLGVDLRGFVGFGYAAGIYLLMPTALFDSLASYGVNYELVHDPATTSWQRDAYRADVKAEIDAYIGGSKKRKRLHTGLKAMLVGMNWWRIGDAKKVRPHDLHCVASQVGDPTEAGSIAAWALGYFPELVPDVVANGDLVVPMSSQIGQRPSWAQAWASPCTDTWLGTDGYVHSRKLDLSVIAYVGVNLHSAPEDWCGPNWFDVGLAMQTWTGIGGPACSGMTSIPSLSNDDADGDGYAVTVDDCDDARASVNPAQPEVCDGLDNDCNGVFDDGLTCTSDLDGDGYSSYGGDCDDTDPTRYPGAPEGPCDYVDNDCNGLVDDGLGCEADNDSDGWDIYEGDCDDWDSAVHPDATELCDGQDQDCDGAPDLDEVDLDGDGWMVCAGDCDDAEPSTHPGAVEGCDNVDSDCDGDLADGAEDWDGDGLPDCVDDDTDDDGDPNATDCADFDPDVYTGAPEACDGEDSDCDGDFVDGFGDLDGDGDPDCTDADIDGDGDPNAGDCDDWNDAIYTGAPEDCDATDSDCDSDLVDGFPDCDGDGLPDCIDPDDDNDGDPDSSDCADCDPSRHTGAPEVCDGIDQDCDGNVDEGVLNTYWRDADGDGYGNPSNSTQACSVPNGYVANDDDCDDSRDYSYPGAPEVCDGRDNDCDGSIDEGVLSTYWRDNDGDGYGNPSNSTQACSVPSGFVTNDDDCNDGVYWIAPGLSMYTLVSVYSPSNLDHMVTPYGMTEYNQVTSTGYYCDVPISQPGCAATPFVLGYSVNTFAHHMRGSSATQPASTSNWSQLNRAWSTNWADHLLLTGSNPPSNSSTHAHSCAPGCPNYGADSLYLGWVRNTDYGNYTRHFYRAWRADRSNHRMAQSSSHLSDLTSSPNWASDGTAGWIFNSNYSCP